MFGNKKPILERALDEPSLQKSRKYIRTQLNKAPNFESVNLQVGPLCNKSCSHCYSDFGPHRKESLEMEVVDAICSPENKDIESICLTDGEPFLEKHKPALAKLAQSFGYNQWGNSYGKKRPRELSIITNGAFARNMEQTKEWLTYMKDNGWDLDSGNHALNVSCGPTYDVPHSNYANIIGATEDVFGLGPQTKIGFSFLGFGNLDEENELIGKIESQIKKDLQRPMDFNAFFGNHSNEMFEKAKSSRSHIEIPLAYSPCSPEGRALSLNLNYDAGAFDNLRDMPFLVDIHSPMMTISHNGEISSGNSQRCVAPGKVYGNIKDISLIEAACKMIHDPVFSAHNLGGVRFLSYLARKVKPDFPVSGKVVCNTCQEIYSDSGLVEKIRDNLGDKKRTVQAYRRYLEEMGTPKNN